MVLNVLTLDLDCLAAVLPWIWFEFLGFFGFLEDANLGFGLLLGFWDWIWISFGLDWIGNPKVELGGILPLEPLGDLLLPKQLPILTMQHSPLSTITRLFLPGATQHSVREK